MLRTLTALFRRISLIECLKGEPHWSGVNTRTSKVEMQVDAQSGDKT